MQARIILDAKPFPSKDPALLIVPPNPVLRPSVVPHMEDRLEKAQDSFGGKFESVSCQDNRSSSNYATIAPRCGQPLLLCLISQC